MTSILLRNIARSFAPPFGTALCLRVLLIFTLAGNAPLHAQEDDSGISRGVWQLETPEQGSLVLILKREGRASYFWDDNADRTVYQGAWETTENGARLEWENGGTHLLQQKEKGVGYVVTHHTPSGEKSYEVPAEQLPGDLLGQWAKPPERATEESSDRDQAKGFFGIWEIAGEGNEDTEPNYLFVESDRSAACAWQAPNGPERGLRGAWAKQGSELHIAWDTGHYTILRETETGFEHARIPAGEKIEQYDAEYKPARRISRDNVPEGWYSDYKKERERFTGGVAFQNRNSARKFYRGEWVIKRGETTFERIKIGRFGGLESSRDTQLSGDWRMEGQDLFMRWADGVRKVLSPIGHGFLLYEYEPGRPIDGVPTRVFQAAPADPDKLAEHLKGREAVSRRVLELAKSAGLDPDAGTRGWGRTFMRWAWPFSEEAEEEKEGPSAEDAPSEEDKSQQDKASESPWWWPMWSERPKSDEASAKQQDPEPKVEASTAESPEKSTDENDPDPARKPARKSEKKDWSWPF
ncbi:MAG: hypothetical protein ACLFS4_03225 [Opitutales bacterium]